MSSPDDVAHAYANRTATKAADDAAVRALHETITDALDAKVPYRALMDITGMSRERLRMIANAVRARRAERAS
jgi:hypothetical protein